MSDYNVSAVTFIKDTISGAFCLFESMASFLPFVTDMTVIDLGSTDGTLEILYAIAESNDRVYLEHGMFTREDASAFADVANQCISLAPSDNVLFWQADEIWHEQLLLRMEDQFRQGRFDMAFWRYQLKENFQGMRWLPHPVHRVGPKNDFHFVDDGMNSDRTYGVPICSEYDMGQFTKWGIEYGLGPKSYNLPTDQMIMDVSKIGGFIDNIIDRCGLHAPMWSTKVAEVDGIDAREWVTKERTNPNWKKMTSPYNIPHIMKWHVGQPRYRLRDELFDALKADDTYRLLGLSL
jgi:glycosyltransferase involved in cell wall biosynthesis